MSSPVSVSAERLAACRDAAIAAANAAEQLIESARRKGAWSVSHKSDDSPVTEVDVAAEKAIRDVLSAAIPEAAFYGEETGRREGLRRQEGTELLWLVDPIDGTKSFIREMPYFSTQIALQWGGELILGVSNAPAYGERVVASVTEGTELNGIAVHCRDTRHLEDAFLSSGNIGSLAADSVAWSHYGALVQRVRRVRGYGDFCHYHQLCCGQTDLVIESDVNILDIAALTVAVRAAGGVITDLHGAAIGLQTRSVLAAGTAALHEEAMSLLNGR